MIILITGTERTSEVIYSEGFTHRRWFSNLILSGVELGTCLSSINNIKGKEANKETFLRGMGVTGCSIAILHTPHGPGAQCALASSAAGRTSSTTSHSLPPPSLHINDTLYRWCR